jgi:hypothetical protein
VIIRCSRCEIALDNRAECRPRVIGTTRVASHLMPLEVSVDRVPTMTTKTVGPEIGHSPGLPP